MEMNDLYVVCNDIKYNRVLNQDDTFEGNCQHCSIIQKSPLCRSLSCSYYVEDIAGELDIWWHWRKDEV